MQPYRPFSEYRPKDYRVPRSCREAFGRDVVLYVDEPEPRPWRWIAAICAALFLLALIL